MMELMEMMVDKFHLFHRFHNIERSSAFWKILIGEKP